jgi:hypothetical protein
MANYKVYYRSNQTDRKRHRTVEAASTNNVRKLIEPEATEIFEITLVPEPLATERQIQMIRSLGEIPPPGLTYVAASERI